MDLQRDFLIALSGKTEQQINTAIDIADTKLREFIQEVKQEWPVVTPEGEKLPQEYPDIIKDAVIAMATQALNGQELQKPEGLDKAIEDFRVSIQL